MGPGWDLGSEAGTWGLRWPGEEVVGGAEDEVWEILAGRRGGHLAPIPPGDIALLASFLTPCDPCLRIALIGRVTPPL